MQNLASWGVAVPTILLPKADIDLTQWAVIACDQFTQDRTYWNRVKDYVGESPSSLNLVFPEVYLEDPDALQRITTIHQTMRTYCDGDVFAPPLQSFVYVERRCPGNGCRQGLLLALDLERYDWHPDARTLIRATEGVIAERLPSRMQVRRGAPLELPHTIVLIDDESNTLLPTLGAIAHRRPPLYTTTLMLDSGDLSAWALSLEDAGAVLARGLASLAQKTKHSNETDPFLFAVGDGNHSLAAAKAIWEEYKQAHPTVIEHPLRWALVEIENIYDALITFEPIHRIIRGATIPELRSALQALPGFTCSAVPSRSALAALVADTNVDNARLGLTAGQDYLLLECDVKGIITTAVQPLLDAALSAGHYTIDYIHGEDELFRLSANGSSGVLLPPVKKSGFFQTVAQNGPLPRKSFSMGRAQEKRFYLESRTLF
ncbi:hypothetical protein FACS1894200_01750 [Spirochaetia bacterium]|nr:hypothetical protein FACS1894200_01750 [Spirochaetia bacterium]